MSARLLLCLPLYSQVSVAWFLGFEQLDRTHVVDTLAVRKMYLAKSMSLLCEDAAARDDWDRMVILEADMLVKPGALNRIAQYPDDQLDIVGSMYFQHAVNASTGVHDPVVYTQTDEEHFIPLDRTQVDTMMAAPGCYPVDAVGMGFTSIHRRVLKKWDPNVLMWGGEHELGHDMWFSRAARRQGFTVHVDTDPVMACGHLSEIPVTYENTKS